MTRQSLIVMSLILIIILGAAYNLLGTSSNTSYTKSEFEAFVSGEMKKLTFYEVPKPLPDHIIELEDGTPAKLSSLKGKVLFINLWASWCAPCKYEMHDVALLQQKLGGDRFEVVAINQDIGGLKRADRTLKEWKVNGLSLYADKRMNTATKMAEGKLPTSYVVDKTGMIIAEYIGPLDWASADALLLFTKLINA
ncbi:TlpA disulfide reductase family protein [Temperatibacter marinus]|uniref:TlpA disulfide reductase family protein n=1 Tax=Temperatibacter marinus TaxID=1456591 RepID=A0AA52HAI5_9PROT|nr:TlpA disulfide reductase family protein [Temperatibacter marinus]WND03999.1 TlpA disulfide reductase family protein [Temperatibacter marinus]